jgi:DDE_Tnp_1-associated
MIPQSLLLIEVLAEMPDFRHPRGKRHPLAAILALACSAMHCGYRSYTAIAEWGRYYGAPLVRALGYTRRPPCAATLHTVFRRVDREVSEAKLGTWAEGPLMGRATPEGTADAEPLTAKPCEGARSRGLPGHICSLRLPIAGVSHPHSAGSRGQDQRDPCGP